MSLNGVCELSSMLRVDDSERIDLSRKKLLLELGIKQQEGRLIYEVEEHERHVRDTFRTEDILGDSLSSMELSELKMNTLCDSTSKILENAFADFEITHDLESSNVQKVADSLKKLEAFVDLVKKDSYNDLMQNIKTLDQRKPLLLDSLDGIQMRIDSTEHVVAKKKEDLRQNEVEAACLDKQLLELLNTLNERRQESDEKKHTCGEAEVVLMELYDKSRREDFQLSAKLGQCVKKVTHLKEQSIIAQDELNQINNNLSECSKSTMLLEVVINEHNKKLHEQETILVQTQLSCTHLTEETMRLQGMLQTLLAENLSLQSLIGSCKGQSFQNKAEALLSEINDVKKSVYRLESELADIQDQIYGKEKGGPVNVLRTEINSIDALLEKAQREEAFLSNDRQKAKIHTEELHTAHTSLSNDIQHIEEQLSAQHAEHKEITDWETTTKKKCGFSTVPTLEDTLNAQIIELTAQQQQVLENEAKHEANTAQLEALSSTLKSLHSIASERKREAEIQVIAQAKQTRIMEIKKNLIKQHKQECMQLRKILMDEDRRFQSLHKEAATKKLVCNKEIDMEEDCLVAELVTLQTPPAHTSNNDTEDMINSPSAFPIEINYHGGLKTRPSKSHRKK